MSKVRNELAAKQFESSTWFNLAVKAARFGVWYADPMTWEVGGDSTLMKMLGLPPERTKLSGDEWEVMVHPDDRPRVMQEFSATAKGLKALDVEARVVRADGIVRWLSSHGDLIPLRDRMSGRIVGVSQDITEEKKLLEGQQLLLNELNHRVRNSGRRSFATGGRTSPMCSAGRAPGNCWPALEFRSSARTSSSGLLSPGYSPESFSRS